MNTGRWLCTAALLLAVAGCNRSAGAPPEVVARAAGHELRVEDVVQLAVANPELPADSMVLRNLVDAWVDYTLLAVAAAEDSTFESIDLSAVSKHVRDQQLVLRLRSEVIRPDTSFSEAEFQQFWSADGPGAEVRVRHILLRFEEQQTDVQRTELRQRAEQLRQRAVGGDDFAALARQHSQDPGSAERGGDLGFFGRGRMVPPFEEAAFALRPGEISPVVESPFGYHIIRLEERRAADISANRTALRQQMTQWRYQQAEVAYLDSLMADAKIAIRPGGLAAVRQIALRPDAVSGQAANREIAVYRGGTVRASDFATFIRSQPPQVRTGIAVTSDDQVESVVKQIVRNELLIREAQQRGLRLGSDEEAEITAQARAAIREVLRTSGLEPAAGQPAPATRVRGLLEDALRGERQMVPLGVLGVALRGRYEAEVADGALPEAVRRISEIRASAGAAAPPVGEGAAPEPSGAPATPAQR
jgi:hypothetical protein